MSWFYISIERSEENDRELDEKRLLRAGAVARNWTGRLGQGSFVCGRDGAAAGTRIASLHLLRLKKPLGLCLSNREKSVEFESSPGYQMVSPRLFESLKIMLDGVPKF